MPRPTRQLVDMLYLPEVEVARRLNQTPCAWKGRAALLEREGLPRIDPIMGGRYWPAVVVFFDARHGIVSSGTSRPDGKENFDALR